MRQDSIRWARARRRAGARVGLDGARSARGHPLPDLVHDIGRKRAARGPGEQRYHPFGIEPGRPCPPKGLAADPEKHTDVPADPLTEPAQLRLHSRRRGEENDLVIRLHHQRLACLAGPAPLPGQARPGECPGACGRRPSCGNLAARRRPSRPLLRQGKGGTGREISPGKISTAPPWPPLRRKPEQEARAHQPAGPEWMRRPAGFRLPPGTRQNRQT